MSLPKAVTAVLIELVLIAAPKSGFAAATHPLDPLDEGEILAAAFTLQGAGVAQPGAAFQSIELNEPSKDAVLAFVAGKPIPRAAKVYYRQNKVSYKSVVDLVNGTFTPPIVIPRSDGQLGLAITEVSDFSFVFSDPAFLAAMAKRGLTTPRSSPAYWSRRSRPDRSGCPRNRSAS